MITPHLAAIQCPDVLRSLPGWLMWRLEFHDGEAKPRKVPFYTSGARRHGVQGRPEDRQRLTTFDAARAAAARKGMDGIGFAPMPEWGITALDFDNCVDGGGLHPEVERIVAGTYAEFSPSGTGVRAFVRGDLGNRKDHGAPFGFETFSSKGFVTFSGNRLEITDLTDSANTVADASEELRLLCIQRFGRAQPAEAASAGDAPPLGLTREQLQEALDVLDPSMGHDPWLRIGMALHHETSGEAFDLWDGWSAGGAQYPGRDVLLARWDSFGRGGQRPTTAHALVRMANDNGAHLEIAAAEASDDFDVVEVTKGENSPQKSPQRFQVVAAHEFAAGKPPGWLIRGVLPAADLIVLYGEPGTGKSFVALDMAAAIARGIEWRGHRSKRCRVVFIVAEGSGGFRMRLRAYSAKHGVPLEDLDIGVIGDAPNLLLKEDALDVCKAIIAAGGADLLIIDTWAQVTPGGNENSGEDMGKALAHCRGIRRATGAPVLLVHHSGKDASKGARGWSGLKGAADAEIELQRLPTGRVIRLSKQKDGQDGLMWGFDLVEIPVGQDDEGEVVTSMFVAEAALPAVQQVGALKRRLGRWESLVVEVINEFARAQTAGIEIQAVIDEAAGRGPKPEDGKRDTRKQHAKRALEALVNEPDSPYLIEDGCLSIG